ncbi:hypothetical protein M2459_000403 [Parabacteroides sp. PF5-5]|nr:hypothetical protein [Parabacteroides sp. PH5-39]MDH6314985.1 hypothetical protein [Parabacteroides sp. PF5-13]MDH6318322.1 hypothetical protein [Parabacteroides sp. PH5-13]MDH6325869.1 hypothetical protein [Parabacteroides sp. PH5-41]MDH6333669.1 hypothetical protein [Parabacteroides sp. PF5-5]MDH6344734.1 hypothetical protein [Parabacteroides sp. PH5-46]MDH6359996.1 hypothetical protein [Parabacteroides sp. PH5-16]MDH6375663.1 hypothetical protein [Parabacteroides sp. PH5-33]MDH6383162
MAFSICTFLNLACKRSRCDYFMISKKKIIAIFPIVTFAIFIVAALGCATTSQTSRNNYPSSPTPSSSAPSTLEPTPFPEVACETCKGRKGYYLFDTWNTCKRCNGTGKEPVH